MSTTAKTTSGNSMLKLVLLTIAFIIFIFAISSSVKSCKSDKKQKEDRTESVSDGNTSTYNNYIWVVKEEILTPLNSEFGDTYHLLRGEGFSFEESTVPYCVINKNNHYECGIIGEDLSSLFGTESANNELRFKRNGTKNGTLKLIIWIKKFK
ncbi:MAG: hypothetical protein JJE53_01975 [Candidatus Pacebacteria bacterium]|nr:hypothetical protein [Candidatus Paceibacterota bacterium]